MAGFSMGVIGRLACVLLLLTASEGFKIFTRTLSSGYEMPLLGLGTWQVKSEDVEGPVTHALNRGYRHIDTAFSYGNEEGIGKSLKKWFDNGGKREKLFITTKLPPPGHKPDKVEEYLKVSLEKLGVDYVDMFLMHSPWAFVKEQDNYGWCVYDDGTVVLDTTTTPVATWKAMEAQVKAGRAKSIGISNFNQTQIEQILEHAEIKPANLQVELHAYNQQKPLREFCAKHNITVTSYSTLGSPGSKHQFSNDSKQVERIPDLFSEPTIKKIATDHYRSPAQVLLRHAIQHGIIVIPKSTNPSRIEENGDVFDFHLNEDEMKAIDELDKGEKGRIFYFFNRFKGLEKHPQYPFTHELKRLEKSDREDKAIKNEEPKGEEPKDILNKDEIKITKDESKVEDKKMEQEDKSKELKEGEKTEGKEDESDDKSSKESKESKEMENKEMESKEHDSKDKEHKEKEYKEKEHKDKEHKEFQAKIIKGDA